MAKRLTYIMGHYDLSHSFPNGRKDFERAEDDLRDIHDDIAAPTLRSYLKRKEYVGARSVEVILTGYPDEDGEEPTKFVDSRGNVVHIASMGDTMEDSRWWDVHSNGPFGGTRAELPWDLDAQCELAFEVDADFVGWPVEPEEPLGELRVYLPDGAPCYIGDEDERGMQYGHGVGGWHVPANKTTDSLGDEDYLLPLEGDGVDDADTIPEKLRLWVDGPVWDPQYSPCYCGPEMDFLCYNMRGGGQRCQCVDGPDPNIAKRPDTYRCCPFLLVEPDDDPVPAICREHYERLCQYDAFGEDATKWLERGAYIGRKKDCIFCQIGGDEDPKETRCCGEDR